MQFDLDILYLDLLGKPAVITNELGEVMPSKTLGQLIANALVADTKGDSIQIYTWAVALMANESITMNESDEKTFENLVKESQRMNISMKAQVLKRLYHCSKLPETKKAKA
jgi:hypothetical protein